MRKKKGLARPPVEAVIRTTLIPEITDSVKRKFCVFSKRCAKMRKIIRKAVNWREKFDKIA